MKRIHCRIELCLACRACELACAVAHSQSKNLAEALHETPAPRGRIRVRGAGGSGSFARPSAVAIQCRHCDDAPCIPACPEQAMRRDEETGMVLIDGEGCVGCWACVKACPFGAIVRHKDIRKALLCDHCPDREEPACVGACRTRALVYCEEGEIGGTSRQS